MHKVGTSIATLNAHANPTDEVMFTANKATFFNSDESISMPYLQQWLRDLHQLRRQLMLLVHLWAGQPGRALETTALRFADSQTQARNVFVAGGDVVIITSRDKTASTKGTKRYVARFLPEEAGKIMIATIC